MHYLYLKKGYRHLGSVTALSPSWLRVLPSIFLTIGCFLVASATVPILYYQFFFSPRFTTIAKPIAENVSQAVSAKQEDVLGQETSLDMTQASNWFVQAPRFQPKPSKITHYTISIPRLEIKDAVVEIGGEDLKKSLVQYPGTALPGQLGNAVIFGHSSLPQFFNKDNYKTIFSTLPTLKKQDKITVDFDGVFYSYVVEEIKEVGSDDISVLGQYYDDSYVSLITCVPPGTYLRRLVIKARLI
ncbi:MAG: sortase [bacterium]|nr:sortase [bacterium]